MESGQHLQLPPAGSGSDAGARSRLRPFDRDCGARHRMGAHAGVPQQNLDQVFGRISFFVKLEHPFHRGGVQRASFCAAVGSSGSRALRRGRTRNCGACATACRSTRSDSPRHSRRTTSPVYRARNPRRLVMLSKAARCRVLQLPAWNEVLALSRPWDQQWSLRLQQVLAFESDLLEYEDIFDGSHVIEAKVAELVEGAKAEIDRVQAMGGAVAAVESGYMKGELVASHSERRAQDRERRPEGRRRQHLHRDRAVSVDREPRTRPSRRPTRRPSAPPSPTSRSGVPSAIRAPSRRRSIACGPRRRPDANLMDATLQARARRRDRGRVGRCTARGLRRVPRPHGRQRRRRRGRGWRGFDRRPRSRRRHRKGSSARGCGCWSASRAWTDTPTEPSRSPCARATPGSRSSTKASA